jgi:hypothetical protein
VTRFRIAQVLVGEHACDAAIVDDNEMMNVIGLHERAGVFGRIGNADACDARRHDVSQSHSDRSGNLGACRNPVRGIPAPHH